MLYAVSDMNSQITRDAIRAVFSVWSYSGNTELIVSIDLSNIATVTIPDVEWSGSETITFRATDPGLAFGESAPTFMVTGVSDVPDLAAIGAQAVVEGSLLNFNVSATDADGTIPILTASPLPAGATFVDNLDGTGTFDWTPDYIQSGSYNVTFYATDDSLAVDSQIIAVDITDAGNQNPILTTISSQSTTEGVSLSSIMYLNC